MNILDFPSRKTKQEKITWITCYDYPSAQIVNETAIDGVLVGDSVAMAVHGYPNTLVATLSMMVLHTQAVARGLRKALLISDLPFLSHRGSRQDTVEAVKQLMQAGAHAIKIEGGDEYTCDIIHYLTCCGIPVIGHIGLTPQSIHQLGGFKIQGKNEAQAAKLLTQAKHLEQAGCHALVIECVPEKIAHYLTQAITIPTIGIGAGSGTDGQILVWHDLLGVQDTFKPRFVKQYTDLKNASVQAINGYVEEVRNLQFPASIHTYKD